MNDNDDWDEIMNEEDNPFNNPDDTFDCEDNAYQAGYKLGYSDSENGYLTDLNHDIDYPKYADSEIKEQFKEGYKNGSSDAFENQFEDDG